MSNVVASIREESGHHIYQDREDKRHHLTDGLIFAPDQPYKLFSDHHLFKWKFPG